MVEAPFEIAAETFCIPTDYPDVADAPLWIYALRDDAAGAALVDCGVPSTYERVLADALPALGIAAGDVGWVVLTHGHPDHMGGHASLRDHADFKVAAPLEDVAWVESVARQYHDFWDDFPGAFALDDDAARLFVFDMCGGDLPVDRILRDGDVFELGARRLEVVLTRGHTRGHCALFERESGLLFSGDDVQVYGTPATSGTNVYAPLYDDLDDYVRGLERLRELPFTTLCPAHHAPVGRDEGLDLIDRSIAFVGEADGIVRRLIDEAPTPLTLADVAAALGALCGSNPQVSIQTAYTARAHLRRAARDGLVAPAWVRA